MILNLKHITMSENLFKILILGQELSEEQMQDIPNPRAELHLHVATKNAQVGAVGGLFLLGPALALARGPRSAAAVRNTALKTAKAMTAVLVPLAPILTEARLASGAGAAEGEEDKDAVYDRSYRLRKNAGQMRTDRCAYAGGLLGAIGSAATGGRVLPGLLVGFASGTVAAGIYGNSPMFKKSDGEEED